MWWILSNRHFLLHQIVRFRWAHLQLIGIFFFSFLFCPTKIRKLNCLKRPQFCETARFLRLKTSKKLSWQVFLCTLRCFVFSFHPSSYQSLQSNKKSITKSNIESRRFRWTRLSNLFLDLSTRMPNLVLIKMYLFIPQADRHSTVCYFPNLWCWSLL